MKFIEIRAFAIISNLPFIEPFFCCWLIIKLIADSLLFIHKKTDQNSSVCWMIIYHFLWISIYEDDICASNFYRSIDVNYNLYIIYILYIFFLYINSTHRYKSNLLGSSTNQSASSSEIHCTKFTNTSTVVNHRMFKLFEIAPHQLIFWKNK